MIIITINNNNNNNNSNNTICLFSIFCAFNGVMDGRNLSPIIYNVYMDCLRVSLNSSNIVGQNGEKILIV